MERPIVFLCHSLGGIIVKRVWEKIFIYSQSGLFPVTDLGSRHSSTARLVKVKQWNISIRFSSRHMGSFSLERRIREAAKPTLLYSCSVWLLHCHPSWSIRIPDCWTPWRKDLKRYRTSPIISNQKWSAFMCSSSGSRENRIWEWWWTMWVVDFLACLLACFFSPFF